MKLSALFLNHLTQMRDLSPHTVTQYRRVLLEWDEVCEGQGLTPEQALPQNVQTYLQHKRARGLKLRTLHVYLSVIKGLYRFAVQKHYLTHNVAEHLQLEAYVEPLPRVPTPDQLTYLLNIPANSPTTHRDKAIFELLYSSGLRLSELVALDISQIDIASGLIQVLGKGRKQRSVPLGKVAQEALANWMTVRVAAQSDALFTSRQGTRLTGRAIQYRLKEWARKAGHWAKIHPHLLRHACATHLLSSSGDLRSVQELLGHENLNTTQRYVHLDHQHLQGVYQQYHPRAQKKSKISQKD